MGQAWDESRCRVCGWTMAVRRSCDASCLPGSCAQRPVPVRRADTPPPYSTDIAAAWRVVEHLREQGWWVKITYVTGCFRNDLDRPGYQVEFRCVTRPYDDDDGFVDVPPERYSDWHKLGESETLPEAICLAALQVVQSGRLHVLSETTHPVRPKGSGVE